jgi:hypothetical protein
MALKNLTIDEQASEGKLLCDDNHPHAALFSKDPAVAALRERVRPRTATIQTILRDEGLLNAQIRAKTNLMLEQDSDNDIHLGAIDDMGRAAIKLAQDPATADALQSALQKIFATPRAQLISGSYAGMEGAADRIEASLTPADLDALAKVSVEGYSLRDALGTWIAGCRTLTKLDQERSVLLAQQDASRISAGAILDARNQWVRAVNALVAAIEASDLLTDSDKSVLLASLRTTERRADERAASRRAS